ncbi:MAG: hypothetical protein HGGPFJEG_02952 [Ignavibacteria bacterium]|nr:hypothetical protein [Ignavibacteria bacterium]
MKKFYFALIFFFIVCAGYSQTDPLPSWNNGHLKTSIMEFVNRVTDTGSQDFIPEEERIATFDNDGTLWPEMPVIQGLFLIDQLKKMISVNPSLTDNPLIKAVIDKDKEYFAEDPETKLMELLVITMTNMDEMEFEKSAVEFFKTAVYPKFNKPVTELAYKPQTELLAYLRANGFKTYICSGGTIEFMRQISEQMYGIPRNQVIGSSFKYRYTGLDSNYIFREEEINSICDKEGKPVNIQLFIGKRPVFVAGNVRSGGDVAMMRFSQGNKYPNFQILVNHDDAVREFEYSEPDNYSLNMAKKYGFNVVSMKNDWNRIF